MECCDGDGGDDGDAAAKPLPRPPHHRGEGECEEVGLHLHRHYPTRPGPRGSCPPGPSPPLSLWFYDYMVSLNDYI